MPLSPVMIDEVCQRYRRERDRYRKLTRVIEELCTEFFVERSGLLVNITGRTKTESSLRKKLVRFVSRQEKLEWGGTDDVFDGLSDFSGIRIAYYSSTDYFSIEAGLKEILAVKHTDRKDKYDSNSETPRYYKATHFQVELKPNDLFGENDNLFNLSAEIQVCSMMEHVWNEIEHDIGYKPKGNLSSHEIEGLHKLGKLTRDGDHIIEGLIEAHRFRVSQEGQFENIEGVVEFLGTIFSIGRITFRENADSLYDAMQRLGIDSKSGLSKAMGFSKTTESDKTLASSMWKGAKHELQKFNRYLKKMGYSGYNLKDRNSADPALMLILQHGYKSILESEPAGRGRGRPSRIRSLASRYEGFISE